MATRLSVNINKIALIRNARGGNLPNLLEFAQACEGFGAEGITVHPRPDERHIRYDDIPILKEHLTTEFNIEGFPSEKFMDVVLKNRPAQVTLVPDPPEVLTSNTGWDVFKEAAMLSEIIPELKAAGIRVSLFMNPQPEMLEKVKELGADRIELYTGHYAREFELDPQKAVQPHQFTALKAAYLNLGLNAGHDLNLKNLNYYNRHVSNLLEVSIGHALVCDALHYGIENTIGMYRLALSNEF